MEEYDAFYSGVESGGLVNTTEIRALICYLLMKLKYPISSESLREMLQEEGLANYFDVSMAISELIRNGNITMNYSENGSEQLFLTEAGQNVAWELSSVVPKSVREKALSAGLQAVNLERNSSGNDVSIVPCGDGYNVIFTVGTGEDELMRLSVYAADMMQANRMKENLNKDPVGIYSGILASLIV